MKFTVKLVFILFIILICLGIFLYFLNDLTRKQEQEEKEKEKNIQKQKYEKTVKKIEKNRKIKEAFAVAKSFTEADSMYGKDDEPTPETDQEDCPDVLIHRGDVIVLYNSRISSQKPVKIFKNLDEYSQYVKEQQAAGKYCPVLFLRREIDLQGRDIYRLYPFFHPSQVPLYDEATLVRPEPCDEEEPDSKPSNEPNKEKQTQEKQTENKKGKKCKKKDKNLKPIESIHYPIKDGDSWSRNGYQLPGIPMPPPFLKSMSTWDLHHMPPLYIEGGLPPMPIEKRDPNQPNFPEIPTPMNFIAMAATPIGMKNLPPQPEFKNYDPFLMSENNFTTTEEPTTAPPGVLSDNAYDSNWGGVMYTEANVEMGKYSNNEVKSAVYPDLGFV